MEKPIIERSASWRDCFTLLAFLIVVSTPSQASKFAGPGVGIFVVIGTGIASGIALGTVGGFTALNLTATTMENAPFLSKLAKWAMFTTGAAGGFAVGAFAGASLAGVLIEVSSGWRAAPGYRNLER